MKESHVTAIKIEPRLRKDVVQALHAHAAEMFADQTGEWTAVITFGHASRLEEVKLEDDADIVERTLKLRILDAEIVTGPHAEQADRARNDARAQRETAGTLLEGAFK